MSADTEKAMLLAIALHFQDEDDECFQDYMPAVTVQAVFESSPSPWLTRATYTGFSDRHESHIDRIKAVLHAPPAGEDDDHTDVVILSRSETLL